MTLVDEHAYLVSLPSPTASAVELDRRVGALAGAPAARVAELRGVYDLVGCSVALDYVPEDPEAEPGIVRLGVKAKRVQLDSAAYSTPERRRACEDYLARQVTATLTRMQADDPPDGSTGALWLPPLGREVLERTAVRVGDQGVVVRLFVAFPLRQGKILAPQTADLFLRRLPRLVDQALTVEVISDSGLRRHLAVVEDQNHIRSRLQGHGLVAFLGNGAVLPRRTDGSDLPRDREHRVEFRTPERLSVTLNTPNAGAIIGTGIPLGVTVIVGGAEHGKSTLLAALERGVYDHVPGDGRERVVTHRRAVRVAAEPGRVVRRVDLRPFVQSLPGGRTVAAFSTQHASPCLSQVADVMEALELGATVLLVDEDTSAPNFLYRDARTQQLVGHDHEPLTVLVDQARELFNRLGVSTVIATGSGGDYLDLADTVIMMDNYSPMDVTSRARTIAAALPTRRQMELRRPVFRPESRVPPRQTLPEVDLAPDPLSGLSSRFVEPGQVAAVQLALRRLAHEHFDGSRNLPEALYALDQEIDRFGLEVLYPESTLNHPPLSRPRAMDLGAVLNRLRHFAIEVVQEEQA